MNLSEKSEKKSTINVKELQTPQDNQKTTSPNAIA